MPAAETLRLLQQSRIVDDIMHTFNYPYTIPQALLAEKVCKTIGMDKIFYQNFGELRPMRL